MAVARCLPAYHPALQALEVTHTTTDEALQVVDVLVAGLAEALGGLTCTAYTSQGPSNNCQLQPRLVVTVVPPLDNALCG